MSTKRYLALVGTIWALAISAHAQGTFVNLDFESPVLPLVPVDSQVPIANAMPGWTGYIGGVPVSRVVYDTLSLGAAAISIQDANGSINLIQGNYTVYLQPSFPSGTVWPAIGQVGTITSDAHSLTFYTGASPIALMVSFAGHPIPVVELASTPNYSIFGGDVTAFANQTGELVFTGNVITALDDISFSTQSIPEPSLLALSALAALLLFTRFAPKRLT